MISSFVLLGETYYEGDTLLGVYSTADRAVLAMEKYEQNRPGKSGYDEYKVIEVDVDADPKIYWS